MIQLERYQRQIQDPEQYMNTINLGQNTLGVQVASSVIFNKTSGELSLSECLTNRRNHPEPVQV